MVHDPDLALTCAAAYPIFTLGTMVSGVFTATDATTKATLILVEEANNTTSKYTVKSLNGCGVLDVQLATSTTASAALYQAAAGKVGTSSAGSALAFGQSVRVETKVSGSNNYGQVLMTR